MLLQYVLPRAALQTPAIRSGTVAVPQRVDIPNKPKRYSTEKVEASLTFQILQLGVLMLQLSRFYCRKPPARVHAADAAAGQAATVQARLWGICFQAIMVFPLPRKLHLALRIPSSQNGTCSPATAGFAKGTCLPGQGARGQRTRVH